VSLNIVLATMTPTAAFGSVAAVDDYVKSQTTFTQFYDGFGFYGTLASLTNDEMYKIKTSSGHTLTLTGTPVTLPLAITLAGGWNYVPCPYQSATDLSAGLPTVTYTADDLIKSQTVFSTYYDGFGWFGNLNQIAPGEGYKLKCAVGATSEYPVASSGRRQLDLTRRPEATPVPTTWAFDSNAFEETMTLTATVAIGGAHQPSGVLAAFVGGEVRGVQGLTTVPPFGPHTGKALYEMTLYGKVGEAFAFKFKNSAGATTALDKTLDFVADGNVGSVLAPYALAAPAAGSALFGSVV